MPDAFNNISHKQRVDFIKLSRRVFNKMGLAREKSNAIEMEKLVIMASKVLFRLVNIITHTHVMLIKKKIVKSWRLNTCMLVV